MMVGNKERFGIECHLRRSGRPIIGDLWLWADNRQIGDDISGVDLPLVMSRLSAPLYLVGRRDIALFRELSKEEVARLFLTLIYGDAQIIPDESAKAGFHYFRHVVLFDYCMEGFDSAFVALLGKPEGKDRLIWKYKNAEDVYETVLEGGQYDSAVLATYDWLEDQTGYKSDWRTWLNLTESDKDELRRAIVKRMPKLVGPDNTESLDEAAFAELRRRRQPE
jgi:hypothetical protein